MSNGGPRKTFTAELRRRKALGLDETAVAADHGQGAVLEEIRHLKDEVRTLSRMLHAHMNPSDGDDDSVQEDDPLLTEYARQKEEVDLLRMELRALANSIQDTKREIAALRTHDEESDRLVAVASELDAVVGATERATDGILDAAEKIDTIAHSLKAHGDGSFAAQLADDIIEHVLTIFEHCNFQDITGQRITKVVNTLKFVEERVDRMIEIWGREAFEDVRPDEAEDEDEERRLLNGPQLENQGISQDEIDKLFG